MPDITGLTSLDKALMLKTWREIADYMKSCPRADEHYIRDANNGPYYGMKGSIDIRRYKLPGTHEPRWVIFRWVTMPEFPEAGDVPLILIVCRGENGEFSPMSNYWVKELHRGYFDNPKDAIINMLEHSRKRVEDKERVEQEEIAEIAKAFVFDAGVRKPRMQVPGQVDVYNG